MRIYSSPFSCFSDFYFKRIASLKKISRVIKTDNLTTCHSRASKYWSIDYLNYYGRLIDLVTYSNGKESVLFQLRLRRTGKWKVVCDQSPS